MTLAEDTFTFVADLVRRRSAIELTEGKQALVESRLLPLVRQAGFAGVDEYVNTLRNQAHGIEHDRVVEALTTNETWWFRDVNSYQDLTAHVIPALVQARPGLRLLRVWSAACSTGQEPYSIAMALLDAVPNLSVSITATDVSQEVLQRGRAGCYSQLEMNRGLPVGMLVRHFHRAGIQWQVSQDLRSMVTFVPHNLLSALPAGEPFDIIFLRNVLIYFDLATKRRVLRMMRSVLRPGGFLVMGAVETPFGVDEMWKQLPAGRGSVYQVIAGAAA